MLNQYIAIHHYTVPGLYSHSTLEHESVQVLGKKQPIRTSHQNKNGLTSAKFHDCEIR